MGFANSQNKIIRWVEYRLPVRKWLDAQLIDYPTPKNLNYWWNFGSLAGVMLVVQIVTGIVLAMHYMPHGDYAFDSVEHIMRDVIPLQPRTARRHGFQSVSKMPPRRPRVRADAAIVAIEYIARGVFEMTCNPLRSAAQPAFAPSSLQ